MIVQSDTPFTVEQIKKLKEEFKTYIKTVIDIEKKICIAGMNRHFEGEQIRNRYVELSTFFFKEIL